LDGDKSHILGMIWAIILDYAIKGISVDELTAKEGLLLWCQKKTKGYRDVDPPGIKAFTQDWRNGLAFCALIHRHQPQMLDYNSLSKANAKDNLELAFSVGEKLGIPRLLDADDLLVDRPDERSVMTQIAEYFHRFAAQDQKETAARRAAKFLRFAKQMQARKQGYEGRAEALLQWIHRSEDTLKDDKFGDSLEEAQYNFQSFRQYIVNDKPPKSGEKLDLETLFAEIQTELKVNDRPPYFPRAELTPEAIEAKWAELSEAESRRGKLIRENRFRFIKKEESKISEEKVAECKASFMHFDADGDNALDKLEFKAANSAMSVSFKNDDHFKQTFEAVSEGKGSVNLDQYMKYIVALQEDRDTPEQLKDSFRQMAGDSDTITPEQLAIPPMTDEDVAYLLANMPKANDGKLDYSAFVDKSFVTAPKSEEKSQ
jgi:Ca2+-binding EF-hand superfamily protein